MCNFFNKQRVDQIGFIAVRLEKALILLFILSLMPFMTNMMLWIETHHFIPLSLIFTLLNWTMLACGFKGALRRRSWQLALFNLISLIAVFVMTFAYSYRLYMALHAVIAKHHDIDQEIVIPLSIATVYYLTWMTLTILTIIQATQIAVLLRLVNDDRKEMEEMEKGIPLEYITPPQPQVVYYYPLIPGAQLNGENASVFTLVPAINQ